MPAIQVENSEVDVKLQKIESLLEQLDKRSQIQRHGSESDDIDLRVVFGALWGGKWWILAAVVVFSAVSTIYSLYLPNVYQSKALIASSEENNNNLFAGFAGQFGGLASLAGMNVKGAGAKLTTAIEILKSQNFITQFVRKHEILPELMAAKKWDPLSAELKFDENVYDAQNKVWIRKVDLPKLPEPSNEELYRSFGELMSITLDKENGFVTLSISHISPVVSQQWVKWLIHDINEFVRRKDVAEAQRSIVYLQDQMEKTSLAQMHSIFYQLIEEQTKIIMLAEARDQYTFSIIDPPVVPERKSGPSRILYFIFGAFFGVVAALFFLFFRALTGKSSPKGHMAK